MDLMEEYTQLGEQSFWEADMLRQEELFHL